jgi:hypothetical protein
MSFTRLAVVENHGNVPGVEGARHFRGVDRQGSLHRYRTEYMCPVMEQPDVTTSASKATTCLLFVSIATPPCLEVETFLADPAPSLAEPDSAPRPINRACCYELVIALTCVDERWFQASWRHVTFSHLPQAYEKEKRPRLLEAVCVAGGSLRRSVLVWMLVFRFFLWRLLGLRLRFVVRLVPRLWLWLWPGRGSRLLRRRTGRPSFRGRPVWLFVRVRIRVSGRRSSWFRWRSRYVRLPVGFGICCGVCVAVVVHAVIRVM